MTMLPPGIARIESGRDLDDNPVVRVDLEPPLLKGAEGPVAIVGPVQQMRAFFALGLQQCELVEATERARGPLLRVLP